MPLPSVLGHRQGMRAAGAYRDELTFLACPVRDIASKRDTSQVPGLLAACPGTRLLEGRRRALVDRAQFARPKVAQMHREEDVMSASQAEPIAIIGMGCRFPGNVETPAQLWDLAAAGKQTVGPVPTDRWDAARLMALQNPDEAARYGRGCFLAGDVWAWDPEALHVAPAEQRWVDPQFRVLMEVGWEAVEHAGIAMDRLRGSRTGLYVGAYTPDNLLREARPIEDALNSTYLFGNFTGTLVGLMAFSMDLRGPVMALSTMCSSGLVAVDSACSALRLGDCDTALAGAVLLMLSPQTHHLEASLLTSQRGGCFTFDERADGYVRGEGAAMLLLKRLPDAQRDGDRVLAVIRGNAVNNDGQATRMTAPSPDMQQALFRTAVQRAGIDPGQVGLVEAHGAGTPVGDPVEYMSINAVYGRGSGRCALGSVKPNIGHSEPVSGIAGTIKAVECLRRGLIAPNANFRAWNPAIAVDQDSRLFVPTEVTPWPVDGQARLAAVCSYGVTGTNAHIVLESAPTAPRRAATRVSPKNAAAGVAPPRLFTLSGVSPESVALAAGRLADWTAGAGADTDLADVARTLAVGRSQAAHRAALIARDQGELVTRARALAAGEATASVVSGAVSLPTVHSGPVFVFPGQGSQWAGMGQRLLRSEPAFAAAIAEVEPLMAAESGFSLREMLEQPEKLVGVDRIQPVLFGIQVALARLWESWGVAPAAVIGQSLGEVAAAVVAGALDLVDGVAVICRRATLLAETAGGAMASVLLAADQVQADIEAAGADQVSLGVLSAPQATVISGDAAQVAALVQGWEEAGTVARMVQVDVASHSAQMDPILDRLHQALSTVSPTDPKLSFYSTVAADPHAAGPLDAGYWVHNQRDTVRFHDAVAAALADGHRLFIECGPHPVAVRLITDTASHHDVRGVLAVGSLMRAEDDQDTFLANLATVHCAGYAVDWRASYGDGPLAEVPGTAWRRLLLDRKEEPYRLVAPQLPAASEHPLLGGHVHDPDNPGHHLWQTPISPARLPWLIDHQVAGVAIMPGTGLAEMMLAAGAQVFDSTHLALSELTILAPLVLEPEAMVTTRLRRTGPTATAEVLSRQADGSSLVHAHATVRALPLNERPQPVDPAALATDQWRDSVPSELYALVRERHNIQHGPAFAAIERIRHHPEHDRALSSVRIADAARASAWMMTLHPALADEVVQTAVGSWIVKHPTSPGPVVVAGAAEIRVYGPTAHARMTDIELDHADDQACTASGRLIALDGTIVAEIRGLRLVNITPPQERFNSRLAHLDWVPDPAPAGDDTMRAARWLVIAPEGTPWAERLAALLAARSAGARILSCGADGVAAQPLEEALDEAAQAPRSAVVLAVGPRSIQDTPAVAARETIASAVRVIQQLAARSAPPRLWLVSRPGEDALTAAGLRGLWRVAAFEHPELLPSVIDLSGSTPLEAALSDLLAGEQPITEIGWWHGTRHVARVRPGPHPTTAAPLSQPVRPDAAYLVTGGLGGLGLVTARWLAEQGARRVVICGRSAPTDSAARELDDLRAATMTDLSVILGDIADPACLHRVLHTATDQGVALRGVLHAAGVVQDATVTTLDKDLIDRVWRGKAEGAWALHQATLDHDLDFFVVYSSVASLLGSPGQAAYASANAFLDGLAAWRVAQGLPATGIHWGAWSQVGRGQHLARQGLEMISSRDGIAALEGILSGGHHQIAYSPIDAARWIAAYPAMTSSTLLRDVLDGRPAAQAGTSPVLTELHGARSQARRKNILESHIIDCVRDIMNGTTVHISPDTSLVMLGVDSLGAVQLQQRLQATLKITIRPGVIWVKPSPAGLAEWIGEHMGFGSAEQPRDPDAARDHSVA
jgi:phthiocerol/phenolphthiocerol synthesis type-I polyketide synthase D